MPRVLVTGAAGLLGVEVVQALLARDIDVVALDDDSAGTWARLDHLADDPRLTRCRVDVTSASQVRAVLDRRPVEAAVHLAANHFIPYCADHVQQTWHTNVEGTRAVLECLPADAAFLLASTADVYAWQSGPLSEESPLHATTDYGRTKIAAEDLVRQARNARPSGALGILRIFNLYGPHPTVAHLLPEVVRQAATGQTLQLGNLDSVRDYVYVADAARAVVDLLALRFADVVNLGIGKEASGHDVVEMVGTILGRSLTVEQSCERLRPVDRPHLVCEPARIAGLLPWWPSTTLPDGLAAMLSARLASSRAPRGASL